MLFYAIAPKSISICSKLINDMVIAGEDSPDIINL